MRSPIDVFLIDDHHYMNTGVRETIEKNTDRICVVGEATFAPDAIEQLKDLEVDVVLLDILMPEMDGIKCCEILREHHPELKIIALTSSTDADVLLRMWEAGAQGMLMKNCTAEELLGTIKRVLKGQTVIGTDVPNFFAHVDGPKEKIPKFTKTELEVLKLLGSGMSRKEAAEASHRSMYAIEFHCKNLYKKFGTNRIHTVIAEAKRKRIIK